jgi:Protein of unknown function (DUF1569)
MSQPSLYNKTTADLIRSRLEKLAPDQVALWGKMNPAQTLTHLRKAMETAFERETPLKTNIMALILGPFIKRMVLSDKPYKQSLPTAKNVIVSSSRDFEEEKEKLLSTFEQFIQNGGEYAAKIKHPMFGYLTGPEWGYVQWKHFDHHLRQFGQ